eukprot:4550722-Alexandrium_andersonii.AAC.1
MLSFQRRGLPMHASQSEDTVGNGHIRHREEAKSCKMRRKLCVGAVRYTELPAISLLVWLKCNNDVQQTKLDSPDVDTEMPD